MPTIQNVWRLCCFLALFCLVSLVTTVASTCNQAPLDTTDAGQPTTVPKMCPSGYRVKMSSVCKRYMYCAATDTKCNEDLVRDLSSDVNQVSAATRVLAALETPLGLQDRLKCKGDEYAARTFACVACTPGKYTLQKKSDQRYECDSCEPGRTSRMERYSCDSSVGACDGVTAADEHAPYSGMALPIKCSSSLSYSFPFRIAAGAYDDRVVETDKSRSSKTQIIYDAITGVGVAYTQGMGDRLRTQSVLLQSDACIRCPPGFVYNNVDPGHPIPCTECAAGKQTVDGVSCTNCPNCTYRAGSVLDDPPWPPSCIACVKGRYSSPGATGCFACAAGKSTLDGTCSASVDCTVACQPGTYKASVRPITCKSCPLGTYADGFNANSYCDKCAEGAYQDTRGQFNCKKCPFGRMSNKKRDTCLACKAGTFASGIGFVYGNCTACPEGKFTSTEGMQQCIECARGRYAAGRGNTECKACAAGRYQNETNQQKCKACPVGRYQGGIRTDGPYPFSCTPCTPGYVATGEGSSSCAIAKDYEFTPDVTEGVIPYAEYAKVFRNWTDGTFGSARVVMCPAGTWTGPSKLKDGMRLRSAQQALLFTKYGQHGQMPEAIPKQTSRRRGCNTCPVGTFTAAAGKYCEPCPTTDPRWFTFYWMAVFGINEHFTDYGYTPNHQPGSCDTCGKGMDWWIFSPIKLGIPPKKNDDYLSMCRFIGYCNYENYKDQCGYDEWMENLRGCFIFILLLALLCCCLPLFVVCASQLCKCFSECVCCCASCVACGLKEGGNGCLWCLKCAWTMSCKVIGWVIRILPLLVVFSVQSVFVTLPVYVLYKLGHADFGSEIKNQRQRFMHLSVPCRNGNEGAGNPNNDNKEALKQRSLCVGAVMSVLCMAMAVFIDIDKHLDNDNPMRWIKIVILCVNTFYIVIVTVGVTLYLIESGSENMPRSVQLCNTTYFQYSQLLIFYWHVVFFAFTLSN